MDRRECLHVLTGVAAKRLDHPAKLFKFS